METLTERQIEQDERTDEYVSRCREIRRMALEISKALEWGVDPGRVNEARLELARSIYYQMEDILDSIREFPGRL